MSPTELDLPLLPSAEQIRRREFATIRRGYDPDQVRDYLQQVAAQVETLEHEIRERRLARDPDEPTVIPEPDPEADRSPADAYRELADRLASLIRAADAEAERIISESEATATRTLSEARTEADRIRLDAQARAEEARQQGDEVLVRAREEADRVLSSLSSRREAVVDQLQQMQGRLLGVAEELRTALGVGENPLAEPEPASRATDDADVDPRYEDLWVSTSETSQILADLPDLALDDEDDETGD